MATIRREETSRGPRWRVRYRRPDGAETSRRFDRRHKAEDFAVKVEHDRRAGTYVDPAGPRTPFPEVVEKWKAVARHGPATMTTRDSDLRNWVLPHLGRYRVGAIGEPELTGLLRALEAGLAPATAERVWAWVTGPLGMAQRFRLIAVDPTIGLAPPSAPRPPLVELEGDQVETVIAAMPAWYRTLCYLGADAGLRVSEACGLTVSRVALPHLRRLILPVERQAVRLTGEPIHLALPKRGKTREVPIPQSLVDQIAAHLRTFPRAEAPDRVSGERAELVFATRYATPVNRSAVDDAFAKAVKAAGLPAGTRFHDLRHYYASVLIDAGLSEREIGKRLGHSSAEVTARYGHLLERAADRTRDAVAASIAARQVSAASMTRP